MWHSRAFHEPRPRRDGGHPLLLMLSTGMLLWQGWRCVSRTHRARLDAKPARLPAPLHTWEGEGGRPDPEAARGDAAAPAA